VSTGYCLPLLATYDRDNYSKLEKMYVVLSVARMAKIYVKYVILIL